MILKENIGEFDEYGRNQATMTLSTMLVNFHCAVVFFCALFCVIDV